MGNAKASSGGSEKRVESLTLFVNIRFILRDNEPFDNQTMFTIGGKHGFHVRPKPILEIAILLILWLFTGTKVDAQNVVYFQQEKVVDKYTGNVVVGAGHKESLFIAFNNQGCYDSDKNGYDVGNGFRKIAIQGDKVDLYIGRSYWGPNAIFKITKDRSRINIEVNNKIYVYSRSVAPERKYTSSLIRKDADAASVDPVVVMGQVFNSESSVQTTNNSASYYTSRYIQLEESVRSSIQSYEQLMDKTSTSSSGMLSAIRLGQKNMSDWRMFAKQNGVTIPKSDWEDARPTPYTIHYEQ